MKLTPSLSLSLSASLLLAFPFVASAHEHRTFTIGNHTYSVVVGSINEPAYVDDKSGVEVMVTELGKAPPAGTAHHDDGDDDGDEATGAPVTGWEKTLKVEVAAGNNKQTFDLRPAYGEPGTYRAVFFPTMETTYSYRLIGTVNDLDFDATFTCASAEGGEAVEDHENVKISEGVTQTSKGGSFGCFRGKATAQFPEQSDTLTMMTQQIRILQGSNDGLRGTVGLAAGILALLLSIAAWIKAGKR